MFEPIVAWHIVVLIVSLGIGLVIISKQIGQILQAMERGNETLLLILSILKMDIQHKLGTSSSGQKIVRK